jgi:outer membrane protein assembly factor BamB
MMRWRDTVGMLGLATLMACAGLSVPEARGESTLGFRGDGSGKFPRATPPLTWSAEQNVLWATPLPAASNASPIVVEDRVFVTAEPDLLLCLRASDGKILWERQVNYYTDKDAKEIAVIEARLKEFATQIQQYPVVMQQLTDAFAAYEKDPKNKELEAKVSKLNAERQALYLQLKPLAGFIPPPTFPAIGYTSPTPVSDGQRVYIAFGSGMVAAFELDGRMAWHTRLDPPKRQHGHGASPVLAGGKLMVHFQDLVALDPATGAESWQARAEASWGTPVVARTPAGELLVTPGGDVVRGVDGQMIARCVSALEFNGPVVDNNVAYFLQNPATAFELPTAPGANVNPVQKWQVELPKDRYTASPIVHDGLLYAVTYGNLLSVLDAATGDKVYEQKLPLSGAAASSLVLVGDKHLMICGDAGQTLVIEAGRKYQVTSNNTLEPFRSTPLPAGNRLFVRGSRRLFCLKGDWKPDDNKPVWVSVAR